MEVNGIAAQSALIPSSRSLAAILIADSSCTTLATIMMSMILKNIIMMSMMLKNIVMMSMMLKNIVMMSMILKDIVMSANVMKTHPSTQWHSVKQATSTSHLFIIS